MHRRLTALVSTLASSAAIAVTLPTGLSATDMDKMVSSIGIPSATRLLRSAEAYPSWPGIKLGVEIFLVPMGDVPGLGNRDGSSPSIIPGPRIFLAKGLGADVELFLSALPTTMNNSVATYGGGFKWALQTEEQTWVAVAAYAAYTRVNGYDSGYLGHDFELGVLASKDYVRLKPFFGMGIIAAQGTVNPALASGANLSSWQPAFHVSLGAEIELPANLTVQLDLMNFSPTASFFVGKRF